MADFFPNLEDGESWLPSDLIREIESTTVKLEDGYPQNFDAHDYSYLPVHILGIAVGPFLTTIVVAYLQGGVHVLPTISLGHFIFQFHVMWELRSAVDVSEELVGQVPLSPVERTWSSDPKLHKVIP